MRNKSDWIVDTIKYSLLWMFGLGIATVIIVPFYEYLLKTMGGWIYLSFVVLGFLTKVIMLYREHSAEYEKKKEMDFQKLTSGKMDVADWLEFDGRISSGANREIKQKDREKIDTPSDNT
ncbi:MAG: hypothetical protein HYT03_01615 [Candidatus Harrisonbacteria bacterium]|nr:hypothetical protein [Candidatus Harrisonbacteria bacterium]